MAEVFAFTEQFDLILSSSNSNLLRDR